jgi:UDP-N-acetylmuramyl pentapeptide phosphotransferase/UDP-N-acetylglucosamine-1-phosphate transferase
MTAFLVAAVVAFLGTPAVVWLARRWSLIDEPNHRSSHSTPVPRGGGIAVAVAVIVGVLLADGRSGPIVGVILGALALGVTGLLDDRFGLPAVPRLAVQLATPFVVTLIVVDRTGWALVAALIVASIAVPAYVNAFNFMDGINGISGSQAAIAGVFLAAVANSRDAPDLHVAGLAVCGASLGFLPFNAVRPKIFLGDVGSYFLGFWLAAIALLLVDDGVSPVVVAAPFLLYLGDTVTVLIRRARRGERLMDAHREHAYQRLTQLGWSHVAVSVLCAGVSAVAATVMFVVRSSSVGVQVLAFVACLALVAGYLVLPDQTRLGRAHGGASA